MAAAVVDIPGGGTIAYDDLATCQGYADQLGVPLEMIIRHAISCGMTDLATAVSGQVAGYVATLDAAL